jgi:hypothetical protein
MEVSGQSHAPAVLPPVTIRQDAKQKKSLQFGGYFVFSPPEYQNICTTRGMANNGREHTLKMASICSLETLVTVYHVTDGTLQDTVFLICASNPKRTQSCTDLPYEASGWTPLA